MYPLLDHPEVACCLRTGYPSWKQERDGEVDYGPDEDAAYEEQRDRERFGEEW